MNDLVTGGVVNIGGVLLGLGVLPDFNLTSTTEDTNTHRRQEVVGRVAMLVDLR